jgi:hypothetical protein
MGVNIKFNYLYRDAANYKQFGSIVFTNASGKSSASLEAELRSVLIDSEFFEANRVDIPDLYADDWDHDIDHGWHEFDELEETQELCDDLLNRDFSEFLKQLREAKRF